MTTDTNCIITLVDKAVDRITSAPLIGFLENEVARVALKNELLALSLEIFASAKDLALASLERTIAEVEHVKNGK